MPVRRNCNDRSNELRRCGYISREILVLYKNYKNKYEGWVLPKGTVEAGEEYKETALREVKEETGVSASIIKYIARANTP